MSSEPNDQGSDSGYSGSSIRVLEGIEAVRMRPGMYVGDVHNGSGLFNIFEELIYNALDQHFAGKLSRIDVRLDGDRIEFSDDGPGMSGPVGDDGKQFVTSAFTELHATATKDGHAPHFHSLRCIGGLGPANALSAETVVETETSEARVRQRFSRGKPTSDLEVIEPTEATGTTIHLAADPQIFTNTEWPKEQIVLRLNELAALCPSLVTSLQLGSEEPRVFGPSDLGALIKTTQAKPHVVRASEGTMQVTVAWDFAKSREPSLKTYCNLSRTLDDGTHARGFWEGMKRALGRVLEGKLEAEKFKRAMRGLNATVSITMVDPSYGGPTRDHLKSPEARKFVREVTDREFEAYLRARPGHLAAIENRIAAP